MNNSESSYVISATQAQDLLNVDLTDSGKSIKKRAGYGLAFTLSNATSPVHGVYNFYDTNGADVSLFFNDRNMNVSVSGGSPSVFFSTGSNGATYQCVDSAGFAYCANTSRDDIIKVNSSTYTLLSGFTSTGTMLAITPERLVQAGFSSNTNLVWFSKANDFSTWQVGGDPTDPIQFTITAPGSGIKHITYAHGRVYWFKDSSFGYIMEGQTKADWRVVTVNSFVGSLFNTSIFRDDILYFQGNDGHFYGWDGSNLVKLSTNIQATIAETQGRTSNSWTQTSQSDWNASSITPMGYLDTGLLPGSVVLGTSTALPPFVDTSSANFAAGTLTTLSTITLNGSLTLSTATNIGPILQSTTPQAGSASTIPPNFASQAFYLNTGIYITSVTFPLCRVNAADSILTVNLKSNSSQSPGTTLISTSIAIANVSTFAVCSSSFPIFGSSTTVRVNFNQTYLNSGATYWLQLDYGSSGGALAWYYGIDNTSMTKVVGSGSDGAPSEFVLYGKRFNPSGNIVSQTFDNGFSTMSWVWSWDNFISSGSIPTGTSLTYQTQTASSTNGPWTTSLVVSTGSPPASSVQQYIRYISSFTTTDISTSPVITDYVINVSSRIRPSGVLYSPVHNASSLTAWDVFNVDNQLNGGSNTYFVRSSTGVFYATATSPSWTLTTANSIPTVSTNPYFQAASSFSVTSISQNPIMNSFTFNWFEGSASDKTYAIYHDNANWWSVASGTGATTNNKILKFDLVNPGWYIYDIGTGGMLIRSQFLYFGSVAAGLIYKYGDNTSDAGVAINSYWKSKDFFGTSPFLDKDYKRLSSVQSKVVNSTMTLTYTIDGSTSTSYNVNLGSATSAFIQKNVNLPLGKTGKTINLKFGNNAADQDWEMFGAQIDFTDKSWVPK